MSEQVTEQPAAQKQVQPKDININLTLNLDQVNMVLTALDEVPHKFSRGVIDSIREQAIKQVPQG